MSHSEEMIQQTWSITTSQTAELYPSKKPRSTTFDPSLKMTATVPNNTENNPENIQQENQIQADVRLYRLLTQLDIAKNQWRLSTFFK